MIRSIASIPLVRDLLFAFVIFVASVLAGVLVNELRSHPLPLLSLSPEERLVEGMELPADRIVGPIERIDLDSALAAYTEGTAIFVDARENEFYRLGHVPGAVNLPRGGFRKEIAEFQSKVEKFRAVVVYCSESSCEDSRIIAGALKRLGYGNVVVFEGGWEEWQAAGLEAAEGTPP